MSEPDGDPEPAEGDEAFWRFYVSKGIPIAKPGIPLGKIIILSNGFYGVSIFLPSSSNIRSGDTRTKIRMRLMYASTMVRLMLPAKSSKGQSASMEISVK